MRDLLKFKENLHQTKMFDRLNYAINLKYFQDKYTIFLMPKNVLLPAQTRKSLSFSKYFLVCVCICALIKSFSKQF